MVDIKLLWFTNGKVCIKCVPDGIEEDTFELCLDVEKREIVSSTNLKYSNFATHAAWKVYETYEKTGTIPEKMFAAWY